MRYYRREDIYDRYDRAQSIIESEEKRIINSYSNIVLEDGNLIKDCSIFIDMELIESCFNDPDLVRRNVLFEAHKMNVSLADFLKNGIDYKSLKRDLRELIDLNNDAKKEPSTIKKGLRTCKRICQTLHDYKVPSMAIKTAITTAILGMTAATTFASTNLLVVMAPELTAALPAINAANIAVISSSVVIMIISLIKHFIMQSIDGIDKYEDTKSEIEDNLKQLKKNYNSCDDEKLKKKYKDTIDKMEEKIDMIEEKRKNNKKKEIR